MRTIPIMGKKYEIRYSGVYGYDSYEGQGIYTGETMFDNGQTYYEFLLVPKHKDKTGFFPLDSVFPVE
jgi:hypothetical protein